MRNDKWGKKSNRRSTMFSVLLDVHAYVLRSPTPRLQVHPRVKYNFSRYSRSTSLRRVSLNSHLYDNQYKDPTVTNTFCCVLLGILHDELDKVQFVQSQRR